MSEGPDALPREPDRAPSDPGGLAPGHAQHIWSVSQLVGASRELLETAFPSILVQGEVSNFHSHSSGHWYFKLKDEEAVLDVAMFRGANRDVAFEVEDGLEVIAGGRVTIYPPRGSYQMVAQTLEPVGWGALQLAFEQLRARLEADGLFDPARKRPLPLLPRCVGVVTSASGAAWRDLCRVWVRREVPIRVILSPTRVQGSGAAQEIADAIDRIDRDGRAEVLIVGRGGGSREDLWAFNEEPVARAMARCSIPAISAVGHETDITIADLVADQRAATPSAAAEIVAASRADLLRRLTAAEQRARSVVVRRLLGARARINDPRLQRSLRQPASLLTVYRQRLDEAWDAIRIPVETSLTESRRRLQESGQRLARSSPAGLALRRRGSLSSAGQRARGAFAGLLQNRSARLSEIAARVEALSPLAVLARGYSICERASDDRVVRRSAQVSTGEKVRVRLHEGALLCEVEEAAEN